MQSINIQPQAHAHSYLNNMAKYIIRYTTKDEDLCGCWVEANSKDDAIAQAYDEHWDIQDIISVTKQ